MPFLGSLVMKLSLLLIRYPLLLLMKLHSLLQPGICFDEQNTKKMPVLLSTRAALKDDLAFLT